MEVDYDYEVGMIVNPLSGPGTSKEDHHHHNKHHHNDKPKPKPKLTKKGNTFDDDD